MSIWKYADLIDPPPAEFRITLGEGNTPVIKSRSIGSGLGLSNLYFKLETNNPTGSFKDRFAASAVAHMLANGQSRCIATSSGNTGASLAAYCAAANVNCEIAIVEPAPVGKLKQMMSYGADIYRIKGFGLDPEITQRSFDCLEKLSEAPDAHMQVSSFLWSAPGMNGVQTVSFELADQFEQPIDYVFCQAGGSGLARAVAMGFWQLFERGEIAQSPKVDIVQPEGNNTAAGPLRDGSPEGQNVESTTNISGLQVATVNDGHEAIKVCRRSGGTGHLVSDELIWETQKRLAREEGIFSEPAGATGLAGVIQAFQEGRMRADDVVVCLITGSAFKDPKSIDVVLAPGDCRMDDVSVLEARL